MLRVRKQIGCSDELIASCGKNGVTIAMLDTGWPSTLILVIE